LVQFLSDFTLEELKDSISNIQRVPKCYLEVDDNITRKQLEEAKVALWELGVMPDLKLIENTINKYLVPQFAENLKVRYARTKRAEEFHTKIKGV
jgi:hypothetical protein